MVVNDELDKKKVREEHLSGIFFFFLKKKKKKFIEYNENER
jgi:hypothetical protein